MIAILVVITIIWRMKLLLGTFLLNVMEPICVHCPISTMNGRISLVVQRETFTPFLSFLLSFSVCLCIMWNIEYRQCLFKRHCEYNESMAPAQEVHHHPPTRERGGEGGSQTLRKNVVYIKLWFHTDSNTINISF